MSCSSTTTPRFGACWPSCWSAKDLGVVGQAGSLVEARAVLATTPVDMGLVDLDLSDGHGLDLLPAPWPLRGGHHGSVGRCVSLPLSAYVQYSRVACGGLERCTKREAPTTWLPIHNGHPCALRGVTAHDAALTAGA